MRDLRIRLCLLYAENRLKPYVYAVSQFPFKEGASFPIKLDKGEVFLMGDNRPEAVDSRQFGAVPAKDTLGRVMTVIRSITP